MKVGELIKELQNFGPETLVVVGAEAVYRDIKVIELDKDTAKYNADVVCIDTDDYRIASKGR